MLVDPDRYMVQQSTSHRFVVAKRPDMVELLTDVVQEIEPRRIVGLGIFKGGSAALLASLAAPEMLSALELSAEPVAALEAFITEQGLHDSVACHYGIDQADRDALQSIRPPTTAMHHLTWSSMTPRTCWARPGVVRGAVPAAAARRHVPDRGLGVGALPRAVWQRGEASTTIVPRSRT